MIDNLDENIGRLLRKLDELNLTERTVVVFISDNGGNSDKTSNLPLRGGKCDLYEGGVRVPMIIRWPGVVRPGSVCHTPVITDDFFPTLRAMAGVHGRPDHSLDGVNLLPLFAPNGVLLRQALHWHFPHYTEQTTPCSSIREGDTKLIHFYEDDRLEMYSLKDDPYEQHNLAGKVPAQARQLRVTLDAWLKAAGAQMPVCAS